MDSPIYHLERVVKARTEDLEDFTGPLDLILHLLSKNKMEIKDIQISLILDQYLAWMDQRKELDLEVASEFVTMASQLLYIKTRMLLSIHDEEALSEMEQLIATLEAHQRNENYLKIKEVVPQLDQRYTYGRDFLTKEPEPLQPNKEYRYVHPKEDLKKAMLAVLARSDHKLPPPVSAFQGIVGREPYPVAEKAMEILNRLLHLGVTRFKSLFRGPFGGGGHLPGGAGAVQGQAAAPGGDGGGLHRHQHRGERKRGDYRSLGRGRITGRRFAAWNSKRWRRPWRPCSLPPGSRLAWSGCV
mgnify:CR=1 FL=1